MKKYYKLTFVLIIISIIVILNGCNDNEVTTREQSINKNTEEVSEELKNIYDDEKGIVDDYGGAYYSKYAINRPNKDTINGKIDGYYGAINYWILDAKEAEKITLNYNFEFSKEGKYKLLLCTPDKKLVKIFEHTSGDGSIKNEKTIDIEKGVTRIVAIGNNATTKVDISIKIQGNIEVRNNYNQN